MLHDDSRSAYVDASVVVLFQGDSFIVSTLDLASIAAEHLKRPLGDLLAYEYEIRRALDRIFTGF